MKYALLPIFFVLIASCSFSQENGTRDEKERLISEMDQAFELGDITAIGQISKNIIAIDEEEINGYLGYAYFLKENSKLDSAIYYYNKANEIMPTFETYLDLSDIYNRQGKDDLELYNIKQAVVAETYYTKELIDEMYDLGVLDSKDTVVVILSNQNIALKKQIEWYLKRDFFDSMLIPLNSLVEWDKSVENYYSRGMFLLKLEQFESALNDFNLAIRKAQNSELAKILISKAFTLGKMGGFEESVDLYEQIELRYGEIPELYYYWGSTYFENNYIERGCDLISKAAQLGYNINNLEADCR